MRRTWLARPLYLALLLMTQTENQLDNFATETLVCFEYRIDAVSLRIKQTLDIAPMKIQM